LSKKIPVIITTLIVVSLIVIYSQNTETSVDTSKSVTSNQPITNQDFKINSPNIQTTKPVSSGIQCKGIAECISGKITKVVDGDTIHVDGNSIRLALTATPELDENGGQEARSFTNQLCPIGSSVTVDEDDGQTQGSYGRMIGKVYCNDKSLNVALLENGFATIDSRFCSKSEFSSESWAIKFGC